MRIIKQLFPLIAICLLLAIPEASGSILSFLLGDALEETLQKEMVFIPGGKSMIGSQDGDQDERPVHVVFIDAFYISKYEITNTEFEEFDSTYKRSPYSKCDECPAVSIQYDKALEFARRYGYRLPTEAEWERAAQGPEGYIYAYGDVYDKKKSRTGLKRNAGAVKVGSYPPNGFGLFDMTGNAWEWCSDWYSEDYYSERTTTNPTGPSGGLVHTFRGGSWVSDAHHSRVANRFRLYPDEWFTYGFRLAADATDEEKAKYRNGEIEKEKEITAKKDDTDTEEVVEDTDMEETEQETNMEEEMGYYYEKYRRQR